MSSFGGKNAFEGILTRYKEKNVLHSHSYGGEERKVKPCQSASQTMAQRAVCLGLPQALVMSVVFRRSRLLKDQSKLFFLIDGDKGTDALRPSRARARSALRGCAACDAAS